MKIVPYKLKKGTPVLIYSADFPYKLCLNKLLGRGKYIGFKKIKTLFLGKSKSWNIPKFKMGNKVIYGYDCWWIPESNRVISQRLLLYPDRILKKEMENAS